MSFLAPLFLLGGLAVALPVVFHLIRRTSKEKMTFSSLMFLRSTPPRVTRRNRLENIFLLFLRCLVLCLLALGFARPFLQKPMVPDPQTGEGRKIILLVDTSASMRREGLWPAALAKAEAVLEKTSPADQVAVFTFDARTRSLVSFEEWSAMNAGERVALTAKRLAELKPSWTATHLGNALIAAAEAFADADKQGQNPGPRQIVLVTDLQEGSRLDGLQGFEWPRGIQAEVERVQARRPTNAGLQWVVDADDTAKPDADAGPRVRVSNSTDAKREQFQIRWDGVTGATPLDIYVPPGQSRIVAAPKLPEGAAGERLVLSGDDDEFDNTIYFVQPKPDQVNILFLGDDAEKDPAQLLYYLKRAFQQTRRQTVQINTRAAGAPLAETDVTGVRLLIADDALNQAQFNVAQQFLTNGGTALFVLKDSATASTIGRLAGVDNLTAVEAATNTYAMLGQIDFEHPLFAPFADPRFSDFTKIHFWKHRKIETERLSGARILARFDNGDAALLEIPQGAGRLLVLVSGWHPADSQLALSSKFIPLLYSILEQAGGIKSHLAQSLVGDEINLAAVHPLQSPSIRKPDGSLIQLGAGESRFAQTDQPGIYTLASLQPPVRFAVNLDAAESRTAPMSAEELMRLGVPLKAPEIQLARQLEQKRRLHNAELENQQKLWRWLIVAAFGVLLVETCLAGWLTRRPAALTG
jgi:hypothetical protein